MTDTNPYGNPEPVPPASQLTVLPFLAAVDGYLRDDGDVPGLRITVHRAMSREGKGYLQQVCAYLREDGGDCPRDALLSGRSRLDREASQSLTRTHAVSRN
jgi:hypothetical protein